MEANTRTGLHTLADFKRSIANGDAYAIVAHETFNFQLGRMVPAAHKYLHVPRKAAKVQTARFQWEGGSWLAFGKASEWEFDGEVATYTGEYVMLRYARVAT